MSEARDPAIKLFGRTIALPESQAAGENVESPDLATDCNMGEETMEESMETSNVESKVSPPEGLKEPVWTEPDSSSTLNSAVENGFLGPKKDGAASNPKFEQEQNESDGSTQQKVLKKPDKILPCPRCNSLDTKFCYYNNYNVNQPRHFCKNCQRYWTAGGTMRNVPVGAGRRKNKHSASQCRHVLMPTEILPAPHSQVDQTNPVHNQVVTGGLSSQAGLLKSNGTVLKFVADAPLCDSMASVLDLRDQSKSAATSPALCGENGEAPFCASSTALNGLERKFLDNANNMKQNGVEGSFIGPSSMHHLHCYPGMPWGYPWSSGWNGVAPMVSSQCPELMFGQDKINSKLVTWNPPLIMAAPPFCSPTIPFPFIPASLPASFWGCVASWPSAMWNMPWMETSSGPSPSSFASNGGSAGNSSPTLGKHSRDTDLRFEEKKEKSLWVPKTLRIDDPDEAARSSIWATLGINPDPSEPSKKAGIFRAFQPKTEGEDNPPEGTQVMYANPAALSRSQTFQEST